MDRKYRIVEKKYETYSKFYPQFGDGDKKYLQKDIFSISERVTHELSEYSFFTKWIKKGDKEYSTNVFFERIENAEDYIKKDKREYLENLERERKEKENFTKVIHEI